MSLTLDARHCGKVWVLGCQGRILTGEATTHLEQAVNRAALEFARIVINVSAVDRIDSTGMGLLVRFLTHARRKGGDLRLAALTPAFADLLQLTRLNTIFKVYDSEDDAIVSYLQEPGTTAAGGVQSGKTVLFLHPSADLGVFARTVLGRHGFEVLSATMVRDARLLLTAGKADFILIGPDSSKLPYESVVNLLQSRAPGAIVVSLPEDLRLQDAQEAGLTLLRLVGADTTL